MGGEGRYIGYKHSTFGMALVLQRGYLFYLRLEQTGSSVNITNSKIIVDVN